MAIFQPTNVIPSSFTQGTIDVNDNMEISWQVNGNSAMTAFQIDFYLNDANSTPVGNGTGRLTDNCPFYGTDRFGRPQFFTWNSKVSWENKGFTNGNEYKYKITQFYIEDKDEYHVITQSAYTGGNYWFKISDNLFAKFTLPNGNYVSGTQIFYNTRTKQGYYTTQNNVKETITISEQSTQPTNGTNLGTATNEVSVKQTAFVSIVTRSTPTVSLFTTKEDFSTNKTALRSGSNLATSIGYFVADYEQTQGDPIRWIRWEIATATLNATTNDWTVGETLADTGDIYTPTLHYEFNGFFNSQSYAIRCTGISESGQAIEVNSADENGWIYFNIVIQNQGQYSSNLLVKCLKKENCALLEWDGISVISPTITPAQYNPQITNSSVILNPNSSVTWNKISNGRGDSQKLDFQPPWTFVAKCDCNITPTHAMGDLSFYEFFAEGSGFNDMAFSPDGNLLVIARNEGAFLYRVNGSSIDYLYEIVGGQFSGARFIKFNLQGSLLLIGRSGGRVEIDTVDGETITYKGMLIVDGQYLIGVTDVAITSNSNRIICGVRDGNNFKIMLFGISETGVSYLNTVYEVTNNHSDGLTLSPDNHYLVIYNKTNYSGGSYYFYIVDDEYRYMGILDNNGVGLSQVAKVSFSLNEQILIACGATGAYWYNVNETTHLISLKKQLGTAYGYISCNFSSDGKSLALAQPQKTEIYLLDSTYTDIFYVGEISRVGDNVFQDISFYNGSHNLAIITYSFSMYYPYYVYAYEMRYEDVLTQSGMLLSIGETNTVSLSIINNQIHIEGLLNNKDYDIPPLSRKLLITIYSKSLWLEFFDINDMNLRYLMGQLPVSQSISTVSIYGGDNGNTYYSVSVYQGYEQNIRNLYQQNPNFEPNWNDPNYQLYMTANFNENLESGTGNAMGTGFRIYRQELGKSVLTPIATLSPAITSVKDFGIRSTKAYKYFLDVYDVDGAFMNEIEGDKAVAMCFQNYSLLVCDYDETNDEYHVRKQYLFALNPTESGVGNNNSPTLNANFTRYPTRMPSTQNYASGTLQGLIGAIYTVPALIEQIGNYKWTTKPSTMDYFDNVDLEQELYDLSLAPYQLFLRDMKGRLRMIHTSAPITMTTNIKQRRQPISISLPWVEIGDASDVTIIQTPDDYGWNNDNQVLDVQLDVDVATGELYATYPFPYNGTRFYLTGVNKENLTAKTPNGITSAQFNLSDVAEKTTDGDVTATVNVNTENN